MAVHAPLEAMVMAEEVLPKSLEAMALGEEEDMEEEADEPANDDYDRRMYGIYQALPVEGEPDWASGAARWPRRWPDDVLLPCLPPQPQPPGSQTTALPGRRPARRPAATPLPPPPPAAGEPTTAEEYLRRVRYEAVRCPQVVRADIDTSVFEAKRTSYIPRAATEELPASPDWALPSPPWVRTFVQEFQQLRAALEQLELEHQGCASGLLGAEQLARRLGSPRPHRLPDCACLTARACLTPTSAPPPPQPTTQQQRSRCRTRMTCTPGTTCASGSAPRRRQQRATRGSR
jgi:hypothetical protein